MPIYFLVQEGKSKSILLEMKQDTHEVTHLIVENYLVNYLLEKGSLKW